MQRYDAIVLGVGGMGSATVYQLARRGKRVLGLERFDIPHAMGSSHGVTRIIRLAYFEHPAYVPLLRRSYELWRALERDFGEQLLYVTGGIDAGPPDGRGFQGALRSCLLHDLPHEVLDGAAVNRRFPGYNLPADLAAVYQPDAGFLASERCIVAHVMLAQELGAEIRAREQVLSWAPRGDGVRVQTERGAYEADSLVISAGAWANTLLPELHALAVPERQVVGWFQPTEPALFSPRRFPVFIVEAPAGQYYGLPIFAVPGFKLGRFHHLAEATTADSLDRECHPRDEAVLRDFAAQYFPRATGPTMALSACMFTNSPDEHFIIDLDPRYPRVAIAAGFSGHGYKFCSVVGEILADLVERGETAHNIELFRISRFGQLAPAQL